MKNQIKLHYYPKVWASLLYLLLIFLALFAYLSKYLDITFFTAIFPDFYFHISNFSISLIIGLLGYFWLLMGVKFTYTLGLTIFLLIANLLSETVLGVMNTPDPLDMFFGFVGTLIAAVLLWVISKFSLKLAAEESQ